MLSQQPLNDLRIDTAWQERYSGASMNRKQHGIIPPARYQGFDVSPNVGLSVKVHSRDLVENVAAINVNGFQLNARMPADKEIIIPVNAGVLQFIILEVQYALQQASSVGIYCRDSVPDNGVLLATVHADITSTQIVESDILSSPVFRFANQDDIEKIRSDIEELDEKTKDDFKQHVEASNPHAQYAFSGTQLITSDVMTHLIRLGGVHVFTAPAEIPLPVADDGQWFVASVHPSVDLKTGECAFTAPDGETINHAGTAVPKTWFVKTSQEFRFVRINGEWCV
ncbi:hypothetical protein [Vibrio vulnificus]|uniref:hypothetical protein n=1 Tax=Vibrio vulnificus TaxID=672 RepID=UPI00307ED42E